MLKKIFTGACSCGTGFIAAHLGCVAVPAGLAASGLAAGSLFFSPIWMIVGGGAITAAGLAAWYGLRGRSAGTTEKRIVTISALSGFALMSAFHLASGHDQHSHHLLPDFDICTSEDIERNLAKPEHMH